MSPPEIWGPAVWALFHALTENVKESTYPAISSGLINMIVRICKFLPCPDCSTDASLFLAKTRFSDIKTKQHLKTLMYIFHNYVNVKKRKPLFNYSQLNIYSNANIINVANNFISKYHTKGNMNLIAESFQRKLIIKDFKNWLTKNIHAFIPVINIPKQIKLEETVIVEETKPILEPILE
tara:strand:- start:344 stop:883 length:540 start_codon:yes stop_codon:yes gene_type:complete